MFNLIVLFTIITRCIAYIYEEGYYQVSYKSPFNYDSINYLSINNNHYRETLFDSNLEFVVYLKSGDYNFSSYHGHEIFPNLKKIDGKIIKTNCDLKENIVFNGYQEQSVCNFNYYFTKTHKLNLVGNFKTYPVLKHPIITINSKDVYFTKTAFSESFILEPGFHNVEIYIHNDDSSRVCLCPTIGKGYSCTKFLFAWINPIKDEPLLKINNDLFERETENITEPFNIIYHLFGTRKI